MSKSQQEKELNFNEINNQLIEVDMTSSSSSSIKQMTRCSMSEHQMNDFNKSIESSIKKKSEDEQDTSMNRYEKIDYHWFYTKTIQERVIWIPFSYKDSKSLEKFYLEKR